MMCGVAYAACATDAPATTAELAQRIKDYQIHKNCDGMIGLFYNDSEDKARREAFADTIKDYVCANFKRPIFSVTFQAIAPDKLRKPRNYNGTHSSYTLPPIGAVVIDYGPGDIAEVKSISFLYGKHDDRFYLITTKQADAH